MLVKGERVHERKYAFGVRFFRGSPSAEAARLRDMARDGHGDAGDCAGFGSQVLMCNGKDILSKIVMKSIVDEVRLATKALQKQDGINLGDLLFENLDVYVWLCKLDLFKLNPPFKASQFELLGASDENRLLFCRLPDHDDQAWWRNVYRRLFSACLMKNQLSRDDETLSPTQLEGLEKMCARLLGPIPFMENRFCKKACQKCWSKDKMSIAFNRRNSIIGQQPGMSKRSSLGVKPGTKTDKQNKKQQQDSDTTTRKEEKKRGGKTEAAEEIDQVDFDAMSLGGFSSSSSSSGESSSSRDSDSGSSSSENDTSTPQAKSTPKPSKTIESTPKPSKTIESAPKTKKSNQKVTAMEKTANTILAPGCIASDSEEESEERKDDNSTPQSSGGGGLMARKQAKSASKKRRRSTKDAAKKAAAAAAAAVVLETSGQENVVKNKVTPRHKSKKQKL